jgi:hypothetical protein
MEEVLILLGCPVHGEQAVQRCGIEMLVLHTFLLLGFLQPRNSIAGADSQS